MKKTANMPAAQRIPTTFDAQMFRSLRIASGISGGSVGLVLDQVSGGYATPLLRYAPHCLVFGMWDSTGPRGGLGVKFSRAVVSEVVGVNAVP